MGSLLINLGWRSRWDGLDHQYDALYLEESILANMVLSRGGVNAGVIIPLILAFGIGVLVYLYGTSKSQYNSVVEEFKEFKKELANVRSSKESLQYELNTVKDELERSLKDKSEALEKADNAEEKALQANVDVVCLNICW